MAWIAMLALLIAAMLTLSAVGAERNFRRSLEASAGAARRIRGRRPPLRRKPMSSLLRGT